jgi:acetyl-CoA carboxylase biotin carboxyl carrier protein
MNLTEIQDLIKFVAKSGVSEVEIERKDFKLVIKTELSKRATGKSQFEAYIPSVAPPQMMQMPQQAAATQAPQADIKEAKKAETVENPKYITVKSPMIGTFYRSSSPDKPAFVNVGDEIKKGKVICVVEAMKLFNEIESEVSGKIIQILANDASPVEYDQPIFLVDPS